MSEDRDQITGINSPEDTADVSNAKDADHTGQENSADKITIGVQGPNHGIVNNYNNPSLREFMTLLKEFGVIASSTITRNRPGLTADAVVGRAQLGEELQDAASANEDAEYAATQTSTAEMPNEIDEWFYKLDDYERCYVVATALLQGAPAADVAAQARELQHALAGSQAGGISGSMDGAIPLRSASKLRKHTCTTIVQGGGVARLLWQNAEFSTPVLRFLAEESIEWAGNQPGQRFMDLLQKWPEELTGEGSRRSAHALGAILAYQSTDQLWRVANAWANSESSRNKRLVALLLSGAYEVGSLEPDKRLGSSITDSVFRLLKQWTERFTQTANVRVASAAAQTYRQIGRMSPEIALQGIEQLLQLPMQKIEQARLSELTSSITSAYVALTWSGNVRLVLDTLASHVEHWSHQHAIPTKNHQQYHQQRNTVLSVTFDAFFLIAASSLAATRDDLSKGYDVADQLPEHPTMPGHDGRDLLLAGLLSRNELRWYLDLSILLCSAIIEHRNKAAFDLLHQWAEIVTTQPGGISKTLYAAFVNFLVNLDQRLGEWCRDLQGRDITRRSVEAYRERLINWIDEGVRRQHPIGALAQDVLSLVAR